MLRSARFAPLWCGLLVLCSSGCGSGPALEPITGTVMLDERPYVGVRVQFIPQSGTPGHGGDGVTNEEGKYDVTSFHNGNRKGLPVGTYKVAFSKMLRPDGSPLPPNVPPLDVDAKETVPEPFCKPHLTPFIIQVEPGAKLYDFPLITRHK